MKKRLTATTFLIVLAALLVSNAMGVWFLFNQERQDARESLHELLSLIDYQDMDASQTALQFQQAGPLVDAALRQGPGLPVKNARKAFGVRPHEDAPLPGQRVERAQLRVIRAEVLLPARAAGRQIEQIPHEFGA